MSWSSHPFGKGFAVTVKSTGLLSFMLGATDTTRSPDIAPLGIVIVIDVSLQELIVTTVPFSNTTLLPCELPKPEPVIVTWLPTDAVVAEIPLICGAGFADELIDTLSNVAVYTVEVLPLATASPT
jgi:hypothetical protein